MKPLIGEMVRKLFNNIELKRSFELDLQPKSSVDFNIRIPFCDRHCTYCLYDGLTLEEDKADMFVSAIKKELDLYMSVLGHPEINSINFNAGTPTKIPDKLAEIINHLEDDYNFSGEVLTEAHPKDLNEENMDLLLDSGIRKLKIGIQSFNNHILKRLGRGYNRETAREVVELAIEKGFDHVSLDLMFSLPGQTIEDITKSLKTGAELGVSSISTFPLMLVPGSRLTEQVEKGEENVPKEKEDKMYDTIVDYLAKEGYGIRTIWHFSKEKERKHGQYLYSEGFGGLGPGTWSLLNNSLYLNTSYFDNYVEAVNKGFPITGGVRFNEEKNMLLWFLRRLYNTRVKKSEFELRFGKSIEEELRPFLLALSLSGLITSNEEAYELTREGLKYSSSVTKDLIISLLEEFQKYRLMKAKPQKIKL